ncbi:Multidrug resistance protein MdtA [Zhongshania aliphaticivorans]|uniref:Multidrug resistance protein MdtA n=1 Tax=Zhongshania aliphaticivorans TaxID=1470434 RepID=A0A5S9PYJ2_9GAMM|nr:efflux RND transporter periplasmic adaptor subunit [Zhongshania aliphaticivorans]CAA0092731.1 Multidrug resistance protein MdtA [Zhongshania aliphaticivorans]CAA0110169.1 Multidrug resistance protein MdtA [Zhongshania aliphaticivorans]
MLNTSKQTLLSAAVIVAALVIAVIFFILKPPPETVTVIPPTLSIDVAIAEKQSLSIAVNSQGTVQPRTQTALITEVSGKIMQVAPQFQSGGLVDKGELLLRIDPRNYKVEVTRAEANVATAFSNLIQEKGRAAVAKQDLEKYPRNYASKEARYLSLRLPQLKEAQARLDSAKADLTHAKNNLARTIIRAPYKGIIKTRNVDLGQFVSAGSQLGHIFAVDFAEVRLPIPADRLAYLALPESGSNDSLPAVALENELSRKWYGNIVRTEGVLDERSRVLFAIAKIDDPYGLENGGEPLMMGSFVQAEISGKKIDDLIAIPRYILRTGNKVWVLDDEQRLRNRDLKILHTEGKLVYVYDGLNDGDTICLSTIPNAIPGTKVKINNTSKTSSLLNTISGQAAAADTKADKL